MNDADENKDPFVKIYKDLLFTFWVTPELVGCSKVLPALYAYSELCANILLLCIDLLDLHYNPRVV